MTIYHYCITKQNGNEITYIDGVWQAPSQILTMDAYRDFKKQVSQSETVKEAEKWCCRTLHRLDG